MIVYILFILIIIFLFKIESFRILEILLNFYYCQKQYSKFKLIVKMKTYQKSTIIVNNTPIRTRITNQQQSKYQNYEAVARNVQLTPTRINKQHNLENYNSVNNNLSPNKLQATRKPVLTKQYNSTKQLLVHSKRGGNYQGTSIHQNNKILSSRHNNSCANHEQKQAEFKIVIQGESMQYCGKCAAHLASQGFSVLRINGNKTNNIPHNIQINDIKKSQERLDPSLESNSRYLQIMQFLNNLKQLQKQFQDNSLNFQKLSDHYNVQYKLIDQFYEAMIEYLKHVKSQHLNILRTQSRKYIQIAQIECGQIQQNNADIQQIVMDIQNNIQSIVTDISQQKFRSCFNYYNQKFQLYKHRCQEQKNTFEEVTSIPKQQLETKLQQFRNILNQLFGIKQMNQNHIKTINTENNQEFQQKKNFHKPQPAPKTIQINNINHINQKKNNKHTQGQGPFRNLFQQQQGLPDQSPQFKNV